MKQPGRIKISSGVINIGDVPLVVNKEDSSIPKRWAKRAFLCFLFLSPLLRCWYFDIEFPPFLCDFKFLVVDITFALSMATLFVVIRVDVEFEENIEEEMSDLQDVFELDELYV